jgi:hypothetical protein
MGHRVMEKHNLHGKTAARHLVPRALRQSRKRALRMAAKSPQPVRPARERTQMLRPKVVRSDAVPTHVAASVDSAQLLPNAVRRSWKQVLGIAAKAPETATAPAPAQPERTIPVEAPQAAPVPAAPVRREEVRIAAKVQKAAKPPKRAKLPRPAKPTEQPETEAEVDEAKPLRTDRLEDGVVEWGIKREGEKESES